MFSNLGPTEMIFILVVLLLVFGAKRLPEIGSSIGKGIREFKKSMNEVQAEMTRPDTHPAAPPQPPIAQSVPVPPPPAAVAAPQAQPGAAPSQQVSAGAQNPPQPPQA